MRAQLILLALFPVQAFAQSQMDTIIQNQQQIIQLEQQQLQIQQQEYMRDSVERMKAEDDRKWASISASVKSINKSESEIARKDREIEVYRKELCADLAKKTPSQRDWFYKEVKRLKGLTRQEVIAMYDRGDCPGLYD